jgi:itaconyl-CoA hydratase
MESLIPMYKKVGERRYRETYGLYYEDFEVGDVFEHRPGRTITDADNIWLTLLTMNTQQLHFDAAYAAKTEWKKCLVDSTLTISLLTGMSVHSVSAKVVANLGWNNVKATGPVFVGDTLYAESKVLAKRESKSRPTQGIVTVETQGFNQDGKQVMIFERTMLIYKRGTRPKLQPTTSLICTSLKGGIMFYENNLKQSSPTATLLSSRSAATASSPLARRFGSRQR